MLMSVTSHKFQTNGFTLIEVMVVIMIVGLIASMLFPSMERMANSIQAKVEFLDVKREIQGLSLIAVQRGEAVYLTELKLSEGWTATGDVTYQPNGVCLGGDIDIVYKEVEVHRQNLVAPFCEIGEANGR